MTAFVPAFSQNTRAASSIVSVILLVAVVITGLGTIGALGYSSIADQTQNINSDGVVTQFERIDSTINSLSQTNADQASLTLNFGASLSSASLSESAGNISIVKSVSTPSGFENPNPADCSLEYGDTSLPNRPFYDCNSQITQSSNVSASIDNFEVVRSFGGGPPTTGASPGRNNTELEIDISSSVSGSESVDTSGASELIVYDNNGNELDRKDVKTPGSDTITFPNVDNSESYIVDLIVYSTDGDSNGERLYADGYNAAPSPQPDHLVPGTYSYPPADTLYTPTSHGEIYFDLPSNGRIVYQGGAVIEQQESGRSVMRSGPNYAVRPAASRPDTVTLPVIRLTEGDNTALSSRTSFTKTNVETVYGERYLSTGDVITVRIESQYPEAWASYFTQVYGDEPYASIQQSGDVVELRLGENAELYVQSTANTVEVNG